MQPLRVAKTLFDGGARLDVWGDTPYSIARVPRYCGPDHPVTQMIRTECYAGFQPMGDRRLAHYAPNNPTPSRRRRETRQ